MAVTPANATRGFLGVRMVDATLSNADELSSLGVGPLRIISEYLSGRDQCSLFLYAGGTLSTFGVTVLNDRGPSYGLIPMAILKDMQSMGCHINTSRQPNNESHFLGGISRLSFEDIKIKMLKDVLGILKKPAQPGKLSTLEMFCTKKDPLYTKTLASVMEAERDCDKLVSLAKNPQIPADQAIQIAHPIWRRHLKDDVLSSIVNRLSSEGALEIAGAISGESRELKDDVFHKIASRPDISVDRALEIAGAISCEWQGRELKDDVLSKIANRPDIPVDGAFKIACAISDKRRELRDEVLCKIGNRPDTSVDLAREIVARIHINSKKDEVLCEIATRSDIPINKALEIAGEMKDWEEKNEVFCKILSRSDISVDQALKIADKNKNWGKKDEVLRSIATRPDIAVDKAVEITRAIIDPELKEEALRYIRNRSEVSPEQADQIDPMRKKT